MGRFDALQIRVMMVAYGLPVVMELAQGNGMKQQRRSTTEPPPAAKAAARAAPKTRAKSRHPADPAGRAAERAPLDPAERRRLVAQAAYFRAEKRGFASGREVEDWLEAEKEVALRLGR
jgi:hypothetical protein